jgi:hypothetical protein
MVRFSVLVPSKSALWKFVETPDHRGARPIPRGRPVGHPRPRLVVSRVACAFLVYMLSHYPSAATGHSSLIHPRRVSLPRKGCRVGLRSVLFRGLLGVYSRWACTLASQFVTRIPKASAIFVTSMTAPIASGGSGLPGGTCTHWKAPPFHGARHKATFAVGPRLTCVAGYDGCGATERTS